MSAKEFDLLSFLLANSGRVLSRDELLAEVWGYDYGGQGKTLYVHLTWLRAKLERAPFTIRTVLHAGYRLDRLPTSALTTASRERKRSSAGSS